MAIMLADRLALSDSATISTISGSKLPTKSITAPLTTRLTYRAPDLRMAGIGLCRQPVEHYKDEWVGLPKADHPDF